VHARQTAIYGECDCHCNGDRPPHALILGRELPETWGFDKLDQLWTGLVASKG
jgi:hypothetical protein